MNAIILTAFIMKSLTCNPIFSNFILIATTMETRISIAKISAYIEPHTPNSGIKKAENKTFKILLESVATNNNREAFL